MRVMSALVVYLCAYVHTLACANTNTYGRAMVSVRMSSVQMKAFSSMPLRCIHPHRISGLSRHAPARFPPAPAPAHILLLSCTPSIRTFRHLCPHSLLSNAPSAPDRSSSRQHSSPLRLDYSKCARAQLACSLDGPKTCEALQPTMYVCMAFAYATNDVQERKGLCQCSRRTRRSTCYDEAETGGRRSSIAHLSLLGAELAR
jgi:hypothetical protein